VIAIADGAAAVEAAAAAVATAADTRRGGASRPSLLLLALALVALAAMSCGSKKSTPKGVQTVLAVEPVEGQNGDPQSGADALVRRLELLGVPRDQVNVHEESSRLVVEFPRRLVPERVLRLVTKTPKLEFYDLEADLAGPSRTAEGQPNPAAGFYSLLAPQQPRVEFEGSDAWDLFDTRTKRLIAGPAATPEGLFRTRVAKKRHIKPGKPPYVVFGVPKKTVVVSCGTGAVVCPGVGVPARRSWYLFKYDTENKEKQVPELTGADLNLSGTRADVDPSRGPVVLMQFTAGGSRKFQKITQSLYQRGSLLNTPQHFAIVLDREIRSFPQIDYTDSSLANGISGNAQITGLTSLREAKAIAIGLQAGALPFRFVRLR